MYDHIHAAVVGTGFIGPVHVEALKRLGVTVKGILGSSPEKSERARATMGLEKAYSSYEEILQDDDVHVVHLTVPNVFHFGMSKQAIQAGKHVMCEKPLAMNSQETEELAKLAAESSLVTGVTYNIRYYPLNLEVHERVRRNNFGKIFSVVGSYVQDWLLYDTDYNWRVLAEKGGELRAVADIGTHWMDLIHFVSGLTVDAVFADLLTVHPVRKRPTGEVATFTQGGMSTDEFEEISIRTEDCGSILFRFKEGAKGILWVSQVTAGRKNCLRYEIAGEKQSVAWNSERPNELWLGHRKRANELLLKDASLQGTLPGPFINYPGGHNEGFPDTFKQCFRSFYDVILGRTPKEGAIYPTFEDGHQEVLLCEAILKSHREERWVKV